MTLSEQEELKKYRAQKAKKIKYNNKYNKDNYRRIVCVYPIDQAYLIEEAVELSEANSISGYVTMLINKDLKERGLLK